MVVTVLTSRNAKRIQTKILSLTACVALVYLLALGMPPASAEGDLLDYTLTDQEFLSIRPGWNHMNDESHTSPTRQVLEHTMQQEAYIGVTGTEHVLTTDPEGGDYLRFQDQIYIQYYILDLSETGNAGISDFMKSDDIVQQRQDVFVRYELAIQKTQFGKVQIGDTMSYFGIAWHNAFHSSGGESYPSKEVVIVFPKGFFWVRLVVQGANENLLGKLPPGSASRHGMHAEITQASVPTLEDAEALARIIEAKLPFTAKDWADTAVATVGTVVLIGAAAVLVGPLVASGVAEVGLMVGTTGVAEALISLPLVGGLLSRIILSPWAVQMVGLYGQYVDDFALWACTLPEKLPAAMKAITQNVEKFVQKSSEYAQRYGEARYHDVWGQEDASKWKVPGGRK